MNAFDKYESDFYEKLLQYEQQAIKVLNGTYPPMASEDAVSDIEYARELLKIMPEYSCIISLNLLANPIVALYTVRTAGHFACNTSNKIYVKYFKYDKEREICCIPYKNMTFHTIYDLVEKIVAGANRETAMRLVDKVIEYYQLMGEFPNFDYIDKCTYNKQQEFQSKMRREHYKCNSGFLTFPDDYVARMIQYLNDYLKPAKIRKREDLPLEPTIDL